MNWESLIAGISLFNMRKEEWKAPAYLNGHTVFLKVLVSFMKAKFEVNGVLNYRFVNISVLLSSFCYVCKFFFSFSCASTFA